jgi:predicted Na+-dependent transporter
MKSGFRDLLRNRNLILILAIILGFLFWPLASFTKSLMNLAIILAITLSLCRIEFKQVFIKFNVFVSFGTTLLFSYILLGGSYIALAYLLLDDPLVINGFIIMAAAPPAIAIIPFSHALKANLNRSVIGTLNGYALTFLTMPLMAGLFFEGNVDLSGIFGILVILILVPLVISQIVRLTGVVPRTEKHYGAIINWCFFLTTFSIVGLNRDLIVSEPELVLVIFVISLVSTFGLGTLIRFILKLYKVSDSTSSTYQLLGTMKNWSGAGVIALNLFGPTASLPGTIALISGICYYVWLSWRYERQRIKNTLAENQRAG